MPDILNKQAIINLLIDSPLREPIKINLIDIVNNTSEPDLPKVFSTITKELEIFQKATERRMKLAQETIDKLGGALPPLDLPPAPTVPTMPITPTEQPEEIGLTAPQLDLPPASQMPTLTQTPPMPGIPTPESPAPAPQNLEPLGGPAPSKTSDEDALAEIQKELDSLKSEAAADIAASAAPAPTNPPVQQ